MQMLGSSLSSGLHSFIDTIASGFSLVPRASLATGSSKLLGLILNLPPVHQASK